MPYIKQSQRKRLDPYIEPLLAELRDWQVSDGEINYVIMRIIDGLYGVDSFARLNAGMGVLSCAAHEWYRRRIVPYESLKCFENGEVFE